MLNHLGAAKKVNTLPDIGKIMIAFGPVPSRRLGRSLGINNMPDKICSYACVYCQIGKTLHMDINRREYYAPLKIYEEVGKIIRDNVDYITFVPDGEPTLDINLGKTARLLKDYGLKLAIITNSSLVYREDVLSDLMEFDYISLKVDAVTTGIWKRINRPHKNLDLEKIKEGMLNLRKEFGGTLVTETMLIDGIDYNNEIAYISEFLRILRPDTAYIAIPTRPPAERWVKPPSEETLNYAYHVLSSVVKTEFLISYEGYDFDSTGNFKRDVLSITSVHPMREDAVRDLMRKDNASEEDLKKLVESGELIRVHYRGHTYYMRALPSRKYMGGL